MSAPLRLWTISPLILLVAPAAMADDATGADVRTASVVVAVDGLQKSRSGAT